MRHPYYQTPREEQRREPKPVDNRPRLIIRPGARILEAIQ